LENLKERDVLGALDIDRMIKIRAVTGCCECDNELLVSKRCGLLPSKNSVPWRRLFLGNFGKFIQLQVQTYFLEDIYIAHTALHRVRR
jgi:hypothetical protein